MTEVGEERKKKGEKEHVVRFESEKTGRRRRLEEEGWKKNKKNKKKEERRKVTGNVTLGWYCRLQKRGDWEGSDANSLAHSKWFVVAIGVHVSVLQTKSMQTPPPVYTQLRYCTCGCTGTAHVCVGNVNV